MAHGSMGSAVTPTQSGSGGANPFMMPQAGATPATLGTPDGGTGGQLRSRFDAFRQRLMKRRDDTPTAGSGAGPGAKPKENFFSDDEGE
jgi:hypothetical protein